MTLSHRTKEFSHLTPRRGERAVPELRLLTLAISVLVEAERDGRSSTRIGAFRECLSSSSRARLLSVAERHRMVSALHTALAKTSSREEHKDLRSELAAIGRRDTVATLVALNVLREISRSFERAGIRHAAFKGPILSAQLLGDGIPRRFADLDIVVAKDQIAEAIDLLKTDGYRSAEWDDPSFRRWALAHLHHIAVDAPSGHHIELHWRTSPPWIDPSGSEYQSNDFPAVTEIEGVLTFPVYFHWARAVEHHARHGWSRLAMVFDGLAYDAPPDTTGQLTHASFSQLRRFRIASKTDWPHSTTAPFNKLWESAHPYAEDFGEAQLFRSFDALTSITCRGRALLAAAAYPLPRERLYRLVRLPTMWSLTALGITEGPRASDTTTLLGRFRSALKDTAHP